MAEGKTINAKRVAKLVTANWWLVDKERPKGVALEASGDGVWVADGWTAWRISGPEAEWLNLTLQADAVAHRARGLAELDATALIARSLEGAVDLTATNFLLRMTRDRMVRMFVGPAHDDVAFVDTSHLDPVLDVMQLRWRSNNVGTGNIVGGTLTDDLLMVAPVFILGDHSALARAWRSWAAEDIDNDTASGTAHGSQEELDEKLMPWSPRLVSNG